MEQKARELLKLGRRFIQRPNCPTRAFRATNEHMEIKLTAVFRKFPEGYAAFVEELPGAEHSGQDPRRSA